MRVKASRDGAFCPMDAMDAMYGIRRCGAIIAPL
jgi:hypothetical protein